MKQLPGLQSKTLPRWLRTIMAGAITMIATIWLFSLLPFLLLAALVLSVTLIYVARRLRREIEEASFSVDKSWSTDKDRNVNITPWHRQIRNSWREFSSGKAR